MFFRSLPNRLDIVGSQKVRGQIEELERGRAIPNALFLFLRSYFGLHGGWNFTIMGYGNYKKMRGTDNRLS
jgi:hypothetical protein